jgi:serine/threonine protein kinase
VYRVRLVDSGFVGASAMNPERWLQIEQIFHEALELDEEARQRFLHERCQGDTELYLEVLSMLAADNPQASVIEPAVAQAAVRWQESQGSAAGRRIGPYQVVRELGRGGMGAVYEATRTDGEFVQSVAIKLAYRGLDSDLLMQRFRTERQILARLDHPNVARLLDGGTTAEGEPYFVMELVHGEPVTKYCQHNGLPLLARLRLFLSVCDAVQYAHQNLIVHRDLKPSNILVTQDAMPKLLDFGIAKLISPESWNETSAQTVTEIRMLTPGYASPEQLRGEAITTATDVYSLGTVLYEMVTGVKAHQPRSGDLDLQHVICEVEPERPSSAASRLEPADRKLFAQLSGDLDNIILMALRKDPKRRYASVEQFAADIRRHLDDMPVLARRETALYRIRKYARRNRFRLIAASLVALSLIGGTAASLQQARRAESRFQQARKLANAFILDVDNQIATLPGSMGARQTVVRIGLEYLDNLSRESRNDPELEAEMALAYLRIGDAQGFGVRSNLGQPDAALQSFERALQIAERVSQDHPSTGIQRVLARAHHRVAYVSRNLRGFSESLQHTNAGLLLAEDLYRREPLIRENTRVLLELLGLRGGLLLTPETRQQGREDWLRAFTIAEAWAGSEPGVESLTALGNAHWRLCRLHGMYGDRPKAVWHGEQSIRIFEQLRQQNPSSDAIRRDLWNAYGQTGYLLAESSDPAERKQGLMEYRKALALAEELSRSDSLNVRASTDLLLSYQQYCELMSMTDPNEALDWCHKAVAVGNSGGPVPAGMLRSVWLTTAGVFEKMKRYPEAIVVLDRATAEQLRLLQREPGNREHRAYLKTMYETLARVHRAKGDSQAAERTLDQARRIGD